MTDPNVERVEQRQVTMSNSYGEARFLNGALWALDLGPTKDRRGTLPLPRTIEDTADILTGYIGFLRFVRAEVLRLRDGAQEVEDGE